MKLGSLASARPNYYDRNATTTVLSYTATIAPHAYTVRFTNTVATGRKLLVEQGQARILRSTAATVSGDITTEIVVISGGSSLYISNGYVNSNTLYSPQYNYVYSQFTVYAGEELRAATSDGSTGGTVQYILSTKATTYDA